jgi:hypothetical protein
MKRNKRLALRLSESEYQAIADNAKGEGKTITDYVRTKSMGLKSVRTENNESVRTKESFIESTLPESYIPKVEPVKPIPKDTNKPVHTGTKYGFLDI